MGCLDARGNQAGRGRTLTQSRWPLPTPPQRSIAGIWPDSAAPPLASSLLAVLEPNSQRPRGWVGLYLPLGAARILRASLQGS